MVFEVYNYLYDIFDSIEIVEQHISNIPSLSDYLRDIKTIDAVERRLSIIGEALNKVIKLEPGIEITDKDRIINLRHLLVHHYNKSDDSTIWTIVTNNLPI